jgi:hypothetical protein
MSNWTEAKFNALIELANRIGEREDQLVGKKLTVEDGRIGLLKKLGMDNQRAMDIEEDAERIGRLTGDEREKAIQQVLGEIFDLPPTRD